MYKGRPSLYSYKIVTLRKKCLEGGHMLEILNIILKGAINIEWKLKSNNKGHGPIRDMKE